jgi:hypothetical protein
VLLGRLFIFFWKKRSTVPAPDHAPSTIPPDKTSFSKPTPDDITMQVESLPPFQQRTGWDAYIGLEVCWQAMFRGIGEDEPANKADPSAKKWVVDLKHYDPSVRYSPSNICCPGVDIEKYPQFKSLHHNELLIVRGKVEAAQFYWVLLHPANFEFCGKRIEESKSSLF